MKKSLLFMMLALPGWAICFFVSDDQNKMILVSTERAMVPVVEVREVVLNAPRTGSRYLNWSAAVQLRSGQTVNVRVAYSPIHEVGDCMPITVGHYEQGGAMAVLDVETWRYGGYFSGENHCDSSP